MNTDTTLIKVDEYLIHYLYSRFELDSKAMRHGGPYVIKTTSYEPDKLEGTESEEIILIMQRELDLHELLKLEDLDKIRLFNPCAKGRVVLRNITGGCSDDRGIVKADANYGYEPKVKIKNPTVKDLIVALHRVKTKKFDHWYELYSSCTISTSAERGILIKAEFNHGS